MLRKKTGKTTGKSIPKSETYNLNNSCPVIAYPASFGNINQIKDSNNFTQTWDKSTLNITIGKNGVTKDITYNVYVGGAATATETFTFS